VASQPMIGRFSFVRAGLHEDLISVVIGTEIMVLDLLIDQS
jgi:hypothetical protein